MKVTQSCPTLSDPMDYTVHGILQARILQWVTFPFFKGSSQPRDQTQVYRIAGRFFTSWATREAAYIWWRTPYIYSKGWWRTGKPGMLQSMRSQRVGHNWATKLTNWLMHLEWSHYVLIEIKKNWKKMFIFCRKYYIYVIYSYISIFIKY